tara:strand:+ start:1 stop:1299 length:1299 start_codon:yes stop_codon:yes gene_type:complete
MLLALCAAPVLGVPRGPQPNGNEADTTLQATGSANAIQEEAWAGEAPSGPTCRVRPSKRGASFEEACTGEQCEITVTKYVPPAGMTPKSWAQATSLPVDTLAGDCYADTDDGRPTDSEPAAGRNDAGTCCCAYWEAEPATSLRAEAMHPACSRSFPQAQFSGKRGNTSECGTVLSLSGFVDAELAGKLACVLDGFEENLMKDEDVCAVAFLTVEPSVLESVRATLAARSFVADVVLEAADEATDRQVADAGKECAGDSWDEYWDELSARHGGVLAHRSKVQRSMQPQWRKIWMAHTLARAVPGVQYVARSRIDLLFHKPFDWVQARAAMGNGSSIAVAAAKGSLWEKRRMGVPEELRCHVDDQFAVGPVALMDGYASLYPDLLDFRRTLLLTRNDGGQRHTSERMLATHLHYRGVPFREISSVVARRHAHGC